MPRNADMRNPNQLKIHKCPGAIKETHSVDPGSEVAAPRTTGLGEAAGIRDVRQVLNDLNQRVRYAA
jgi:hypothetical protein